MNLSGLPFARHVPTGKETFIDDVPSGLACECECIGCGELLEARKGAVNTHHFAHHRKDVNDEKVCPFTFDRCIFWMCRKILEESVMITTPNYVLHLYDNHFYEGIDYNVTASQNVQYNKVSFPNDLEGSYKNDVAILEIQGFELALSLDLGSSFNVSNRWTYRQPYVFNEAEIAHIEVDLSPLKYMFSDIRSGFRELIANWLLTSVNSKRWLYHPNEKFYRNKFQSAIDLSQKKLDRQRKLIEEGLQKEQERKAFSTKKRLDMLIEQVNSFVRSGKSEAHRCGGCFFLSEVNEVSCRYCGSVSLELCILDDDYLFCIDNKYDQKGYVRSSISRLPKLDN